MTEQKQTTSWLLLTIVISLVLAIICFVVTSWIVIEIACAIAPPYDIDPRTGEEHHHMPMGQVFLGFLIGTVLGLFTLIKSYKFFRKKFIPLK